MLCTLHCVVSQELATRMGSTSAWGRLLGMSGLNGARDSVMEWRSKGSLVLSQLEEDTREALKEG